jgi:PIN domain nuclease of toxin-antitoxin system
VSVLIDTNVLLWVAGIEGRLADRDTELLTDADTPIFVSAASAWEIAIKWSKGRLTLPEPPDVVFEKIISAAGFSKLSIAFLDAYAVAQMKHRKHKDPFDRLIVAQAMRNGLRLMTSDVLLEDYGVEVIVCKTK